MRSIYQPTPRTPEKNLHSALQLALAAREIPTSNFRRRTIGNTASDKLMRQNDVLHSLRACEHAASGIRQEKSLAYRRNQFELRKFRAA